MARRTKKDQDDGSSALGHSIASLGPALTLTVDELRENLRKPGEDEPIYVPPTPIDKAPRPPPPRDPISTVIDDERQAYVDLLWRMQYDDLEILQWTARYFPTSRGTVAYDLRCIRARYLAQDRDPRVTAVRKARLRLALEDLYRRCLGHNEHGNATKVLDRIAKLDGLYAPLKLEVTSTNVHVALTVDKIVEVLDEAGLRAFEIVVEQLERAGVAGLLGAAVAEDPSDGEDDPQGDDVPPGVIDVDGVNRAAPSNVP